MPKTALNRPLLKIVGIVIAIIGLAVIVIAFLSETQEIYVDLGQPPEFAAQYEAGETDFQRYLMGGFGIFLGYIGFRVFRYIPYSERERDYVSEEDLD